MTFHRPLVKIMSCLFITCLTSRAWAMAATNLLQCEFSNPEWKDSLAIDANGDARLHLYHGPTRSRLTCHATVDYMRHGERDVVPSLKAEMRLQACETHESIDELLNRMHLHVDLIEPSSPKGRLQWHRRQQPDRCEIQDLDLTRLHP
jgi:hypothetical protein